MDLSRRIAEIWHVDSPDASTNLREELPNRRHTVKVDEIWNLHPHEPRVRLIAEILHDRHAIGKPDF